MLKPQVYHFILDHRVGGPHIYVETLRNSFADSINSYIVTTGHGPLTEYSLVNLRHIAAPLYVLEIIINTLLLIVWIVTGKISRKNTIFAVHGSANVTPLIVARIVGIPVMWYFHETTLRFRSLVRFGKWILKDHLHLIAVVANKCKKIYGLCNVVLLPTAIDSKFWFHGEVIKSNRETTNCSKLKNKSIPLKLITVANINPLKGIDILLEALDFINYPCHLEIVGASLKTHQDYDRFLHLQASRIMSKNNMHRIDFLGWKDKEDIRTILAGCDIFVLPSRSEACPIALLEAMSMSCAVISTDVGDVSEYIESGVNGFVVEVGDALAIADAINKLATDITLRRQFGDGARQTVCCRLDVSMIAEKTIFAYREIMSSRK